jgi:hypothetical protein
MNCEFVPNGRELRNMTLGILANTWIYDGFPGRVGPQRLLAVVPTAARTLKLRHTLFRFKNNLNQFASRTQRK